MITIAPATSADIPALCQLLNELFTQEAEFKPDQQAQYRGLASIIDYPEVGRILVAQQQGVVIGMVNLLFTVSTALGGRVALLEDMVVTASHRNLGIGRQLLEQAIELARCNGCQRITLLTDQSNLMAQCFYQKQGFEVSTMLPLRLSLHQV